MGVDRLKSSVGTFIPHVAVLMKWGVVAIDQNSVCILVLSIVSLKARAAHMCLYLVRPDMVGLF